MYEKGLQQYKEQSVMTMTQGELLVLLYDELLKRLKRAEISCENQVFDTFEQSIQRAVEILQYLKQTLNYDYAISRELANLYNFYIKELSRAKASRKVEPIQGIQPLISEVRSAFIEAKKEA